MRNALLLALSLLFTDCLPVFAADPDYDASVKSFRETLRQFVEADTSNPPGNEKRITDLIAARLKKEGIAYQTMDFGPNRTNLVARLKGTGEKKPLLLLAHIDVVGTVNQKWTHSPHKLTEKDGYLYGRGVIDDLSMAVSNLETLIALKRAKLPLKRDVIVAWTGDEESGGLGVRELIKQHPDWINAEIGLNEGGGVIRDESGKILFLDFNTAEKIYQDFTLTVKGTTGHSSRPKGDNAIGVLGQALDRLNKYQPTPRLLPVTREYFKKRAGVEKPELAKAMGEIANANGALPKNALDVMMKDPANGGPMLITTCIPTMVSGGSRVNALPPEATANINCRILPDEDVPTVKKRLTEIINDPRVEVSLAATEFGVGGASSITGVVPEAVEKISQATWPKAPIIPAMVTGATDARFLRNKGMQIYGLSPIPHTEEDITRCHGIDERLPVSSIRPGLEFSYKLVVELVTR